MSLCKPLSGSRRNSWHLRSTQSTGRSRIPCVGVCVWRSRAILPQLYIIHRSVYTVTWRYQTCVERVALKARRSVACLCSTSQSQLPSQSYTSRTCEMRIAYVTVTPAGVIAIVGDFHIWSRNYQIDLLTPTRSLIIIMSNFLRFVFNGRFIKIYCRQCRLSTI